MKLILILSILFLSSCGDGCDRKVDWPDPPSQRELDKWG